MTISSGEILNNRYRVVKLLGQGGFGAVYRAWDLNLECPRAIKENLEISHEVQRQFKREAQILDKLSHPNLPKVIDHFAIPGQGQYLVMEFVEGRDLQEILLQTNAPLPEAQVLTWMGQVCDALNYLHSRTPPVIHRDIKPANIKICPDGQAMLVDFGIAKIFDPNLSTTKGARAVTSGYSPPEQYGRSLTDAQSDVYALGATMYHLLTGNIPPDSVDVLSRSIQPPLPANRVNTSLSSQVSFALEKAMRPERTERWMSVEEFKIAISPPVSSGAGVRVIPPNRPVPRSYQSNRVIPPSLPASELSTRWTIPWGWLAAGGLAIVVMILAGLLIGSLYNRDVKQTPVTTSNIFSITSEFLTTAAKLSPSPTFTWSVTPTASLTPTPTVTPTLTPTITSLPSWTSTIKPTSEKNLGDKEKPEPKPKPYP